MKRIAWTKILNLIETIMFFGFLFACMLLTTKKRSRKWKWMQEFNHLQTQDSSQSQSQRFVQEALFGDTNYTFNMFNLVFKLLNWKINMNLNGFHMMRLRKTRRINKIYSYYSKTKNNKQNILKQITLILFIFLNNQPIMTNRKDNIVD